MNHIKPLISDIFLKKPSVHCGGHRGGGGEAELEARSGGGGSQQRVAHSCVTGVAAVDHPPRFPHHRGQGVRREWISAQVVVGLWSGGA
jgi:hypothetical protein